MDTIGNIDSKFRFVILAAKRAKQLLKGAKPKIRTRSHNLIRIAQQEVRAGSIEFDILPVSLEEPAESEERVLVADEGVGGEAVEDDAEVEGGDEPVADEEEAAEPEEDEESDEDEEPEETVPAEDEDK